MAREETLVVYLIILWLGLIYKAEKLFTEVTAPCHAFRVSLLGIYTDCDSTLDHVVKLIVY